MRQGWARGRGSHFDDEPHKNVMFGLDPNICRNRSTLTCSMIRPSRGD